MMKKKTDENILNILVQANPSFIYHSYIKCGINEEENIPSSLKLLFLFLFLFYEVKCN